jgi:hypothetical protein
VTKENGKKIAEGLFEGTSPAGTTSPLVPYHAKRGILKISYR